MEQLREARASGWYQLRAGKPWHHYTGVKSLCERVELEGVPDDGFRSVPFGSAPTCRVCRVRRTSQVFAWPSEG